MKARFVRRWASEGHCAGSARTSERWLRWWRGRWNTRDNPLLTPRTFLGGSRRSLRFPDSPRFRRTPSPSGPYWNRWARPLFGARCVPGPVPINRGQPLGLCCQVAKKLLLPQLPCNVLPHFPVPSVILRHTLSPHWQSCPPEHKFWSFLRHSAHLLVNCAVVLNGKAEFVLNYS